MIKVFKVSNAHDFDLHCIVNTKTYKEIRLGCLSTFKGYWNHVRLNSYPCMYTTKSGYSLICTFERPGEIDFQTVFPELFI